MFVTTPDGRRAAIGAHVARLSAVMALLVVGCSPAAPAEGPTRPPGQQTSTGAAPSGGRESGGELRLAFPTTDAGDARTLDPQVDGATYANTITAALYDSLVYQDPKDNSIKPGLAESWTVSPDGMEYTLKLRANARFHDGTPVNAAAVKFTLDRAVDPQFRPGNSYPATLLVSYERTEILDDHTAKIVLKRPQANFLQSALGRSYMGVVSPTAVQKLGVAGFAEHPVGSGPFRFVEWVHGDHITVERNPDYAWSSPIFEQQGPPSVDRITFRFIPEATTRLAALESGEVNAIDGVPEADQQRLASDARFEIIEIRKNGSPGRVDVNNQLAPTNEKAVRIALSQATNRDALNRTVWYGVHVPALGLLEDKMWAFNPDARAPAFDADKARQTLQEAGWIPGGDGGIRTKAGKPLEVLGVTWSENLRVMEALQAQWKDVGIALKIEPMSRAAVAERTSAGTFNVTFDIPWGWTNEDPHLLYTHYNTANMPPKASSNAARFSNPEVDRLTEAAYQELDPNKRKDMYMKVQEIVTGEAVNVPLISMYRNIAVKKGVHGVRPDVRGTYRYLNDVWIEKSAR